MKLAGKTILLTGAAGGIGEAIAQALAAQDASLILQGRNLARLENLRAQLAHPERHHCLNADLCNPSERERLASDPRIVAGIDILLNNAGSNTFAWLQDQRADEIHAQIALNIEAPILLTRALLPRLRRPGLIMNIGSSLGAIGYPGYSVYCASKFALRGFSEALHRELTGSGLKVLYLAPRATRTALNSEAVYALNSELGVQMDSPHWVAEQVADALIRETRWRWLGWPETLFTRLNGLLPALVDKALAKQLPVIARHAGRTSSPQEKNT